MSITRRELITAAFAELGISNEFDVSPDELTRAVGNLNRLLESRAVWRGIGYSPGTGLDDQTGIIGPATDTVVLNLALRLAPGVGKIPHPDLKRDARIALLGLLTKQAILIPVQLPAEMPAGAGNRRYTDRNFLCPPTDPVETGAGTTIDGVDLE